MNGVWGFTPKACDSASGGFKGVYPLKGVAGRITPCECVLFRPHLK